MSAPHATAASPPAHACSAEELFTALGSRRAGLSEHEARERQRIHGPNRLHETRARGAWGILVDQFRSLLVALLAAAAALSLAFGREAEALAIGAVLLVNGAIGFASELRAVRSMEALRRLGHVRTTVRRDGRVRVLDAALLVPGDVVLLEGGDVVSADLRLFEASKLQADESTLTGESAPVGKRTAPLAAETPLADRRNMLFKGTSVTRGAGEALVVGTGMATELGRITRLVEEAEAEVTPLEQRLDQLGQRLVWLTLVVAAGIVASGLAAGRDWLPVVQTGIALAVATVPEGLPIIATLALARGMHRMARRNALVNRLSAVETLGATGIIFCDKTGTLTENRMAVVELALAADELRRRALEVAVLCNDAALDGPAGVGDPLELALLAAGREAGLERPALLRDAPELREVAFDPALRMMATVHRLDGAFRVAVKGAPEAVLAVSTRIAGTGGDRALDDAERAAWTKRNEEMAARGLRVLALAERSDAEVEADPYRELVWLGLVGLQDPPRPEVRDAIAACRSAGIRVAMLTGDQLATARNIARAVGIEDHEVFARVSPEQKLALITAHQRQGHVVAMTGDGVNDAPALRKADIGVAMGLRGTEVARQAADVVLRDDAFATIVAAIAQGRVIFDNLRAFVLYLLSCNLSEIGIVAIASIANAPLPLLPLQILFLNLVTDVFPALALGVGEGTPAVMQRPPRDPSEHVLERRHWSRIAGHAALMTAAVLVALALALGPLGADERHAVTISFLTLAFTQLWHVFDMRGPGSGWLRNEITGNRWIWGALLLCAALILSAVFVAPLAALLQVTRPTPQGWLLVAGASLAPVAVGQALALLGIRPFGSRATAPAVSG
jgi:Ca2+-transporting ATPase